MKEFSLFFGWDNGILIPVESVSFRSGYRQYLLILFDGMVEFFGT